MCVKMARVVMSSSTCNKTTTENRRMKKYNIHTILHYIRWYEALFSLAFLEIYCAGHTIISTSRSFFLF